MKAIKTLIITTLMAMATTSVSAGSQAMTLEARSEFGNSFEDEEVYDDYNHEEPRNEIDENPYEEDPYIKELQDNDTVDQEGSYSDDYQDNYQDENIE